MKISTFCLTAILLLEFYGCALGEKHLREFYKTQTDIADFGKNGIQPLEQNQNIQIESLGKKIDNLNLIIADSVFLKYLADGYVVIGFADFWNESDLTLNMIKKVAKEKGASVVLYYKEYLGSRTSAIALDTPTTNTTYHQGNVMGNGLYNSYNYTGTSTTHGTKTTYVPITLHRNAHQLFFLAHSNWCEQSDLGIIYNNLDINDRYQSDSNQGVKVFIVCNNSPAFAGNLMPGDVITKVNQIKIADVNHMDQMLIQAKGFNKPLSFEIKRFKDTKIISIMPNIENQRLPAGR